jgi:hypothetical protein
MSNTVSKTTNGQKAKFTPDIVNFKVSLSYEGLALKKNIDNQSIADLKRKHAR